MNRRFGLKMPYILRAYKKGKAKTYEIFTNEHSRSKQISLNSPKKDNEENNQQSI